MGNPKSRVRVPKKSGILSGIMKQNIKFGVKSAQRSGSGRVGYIPDLEKSGSGSPKKVGFG